MTKNYSKTWFTDIILPSIKSVVLTGIFSPWLLVIYSVAARYSANLDINDQGVIQGFIEWFGAAYSFFLALALVNVWGQFETVERELDRELDAITSLLQTAEYIPMPKGIENAQLISFKDDLRKSIKEYVNHVIYNHKNEHLISQQHRNGDRVLEQIGKYIGSLATVGLVVEPLITELFKSLNEAIDVRGDRITHSKPYTPIIVQMVAIVSSAIWLLSFFGLVIYDFWVTLILVGGVAFVIIMVLIIFFDLSEPFGGIWKINLDSWTEFLEIINPNLRPKVIFVYNVKNSVLSQIKALIDLNVCKLIAFSHFGINPRWRNFLQRIQKSHSDADGIIETIECNSLYSNQFKDYGYEKYVVDTERPIVILKRGDDFKILLTQQEIENSRDLIALEELLGKKIRERISWF